MLTTSSCRVAAGVGFFQLAAPVAIDNFLATSASLNGVIVPGRSLERTLARNTFNLFINNDADPVYRVLLRGSATAIRFEGREILLCTQHQLQGVPLEHVGMVTGNGEKIITSGGTRYYTPKDSTDAYDLIAFNFTEPCREHRELRSGFFDLRQIPPHVPLPDVIGLVLFGFPFADQSYDVSEENNHIGVAKRSVVCRMDAAPPADDALLRVSPVRPIEFDCDGMSGGSAFVVQIVNGQIQADFAGVIVRGGKTGFYILKAGLVRNFLKAANWPEL